MEKWVQSKFKPLGSTTYLLDKSNSVSEVGDLYFKQGGYTFIGDAKLINVHDYKTKCKEDSKLNVKTIQKHVYDMNTALKSIFKQRSDRLTDYQNIPAHNREKIISFAIVPSIFNLESTTSNYTGYNIKTAEVIRRNNFPEYTNVVLVPYTKIDQFVENPLKYSVTSGYLASKESSHYSG